MVERRRWILEVGVDFVMGHGCQGRNRHRVARWSVWREFVPCLQVRLLLGTRNQGLLVFLATDSLESRMREVGVEAENAESVWSTEKVVDGLYWMG